MTTIWVLRVCWALLALTLGSAVAERSDSWDQAAQIVAQAEFWIPWACGLFALLVPRPWGIVVTRLGAATGLFATALIAPGIDTPLALITLVHTGVVLGISLMPAVSMAFVNVAAYGDELRVMLRTPVAVAAFPVPLATLLCAAGFLGGPLLIAHGHTIAGIVVTVIAWGLLYITAKAMYALTQRWIVMVPAGVLYRDLWTVTDPVLMERANIVSAGLWTPDPKSPELTRDATFDGRGGHAGGVILLELATPLPFMRRSRGEAERVDADHLLVAVSQPGETLRILQHGKIAIRP